MAAEGQIKEAQSALEKVVDLSERFIVYKEIATAQYDAKDADGARRTLMTGREEALKNKSVLEFKYTLLQIVAGLSATGFYEEAKSDIKLFEEYDQPRVYLMVAWYQGERKDYEAAKATYREAVQKELDGTQRNDSHLSDICEAQARMGFIDEAKRTLSLIRDPEVRKWAEIHYTPQRPAGP